MKRLVTLLLAAGMIFGCATSNAKAVELTANGTFQFGWSWSQRPGTESAKNGDTFNAAERIRPQFNFIASENLKGVLRLEIGKGIWGGKNGFAMGADGINVKTKSAYVDWVVPGADIKVRMGIMPVGQPHFTKHGFVYDSASDTAGIALNYQFNDMVGLSFAWTRPYNQENTPHDSLDVFLLSVPVKGDGFKVTPWGMIASVGQDAVSGSWASSGWGSYTKYPAMGLVPIGAQNIIGDKSTGMGWWLGIGGELSMFDPFKLALDFVYGSVDMGEVAGFDMKRSGWAVAADATYKLDFMTPTLTFWYSSGDDSNPLDGSERLPSVFARSTLLNFSFDGGAGQWLDGHAIGMGSNGLWGIGLHLNDIQVIDQLKHDLRFTYMQGTNNVGMTAAHGGLVASPFAGANYYGKANCDGLYLTTSDSAWEIDFTTKYDIYKNLAMHLDLSWFKLSLDEDAWGRSFSSDDENGYKAAVYMTYKF